MDLSNKVFVIVAIIVTLLTLLSLLFFQTA